MKTYFQNYNHQELGLSRWGVTLIPPESIDKFYNIVANDNKSLKSEELIELMKLLIRAEKENKYVIQYGV